MAFEPRGVSEPSPASPPAEDASLMRELVRTTGLPRASLLGMIERVHQRGDDMDDEQATTELAPNVASARSVAGAISGVTQFFTAMWKAKSDPHVWRRLDDARVIADAGTPSKAEEVAKGDNYFVIRLKEMYVRDARKLWQTYYPVLHSFVQHRKAIEVAVVGPGQLSALGNAGVERIVSLNQRLAGPTPYRGDDVDLVVGLYSVPGNDVARALIDTMGELTKLGGIALGEAPKIVDVVKAGVERTLGLKETKLQVGVQDSFAAGQPLLTGVFVGLSASEADVRFDQLWFAGGRLRSGAADGPPFDECDYMVVSLELLETRDDWPQLPGLPDFQAKFDAVINDPTPVADKKAKLNSVWPSFTNLLENSPYLTRPDRARIASDVLESLKRQLTAPQPFEVAASLAREGGTAFDFARVPKVTKTTEPGWVENAQAALSAEPFGKDPET
jgi:hypothetical protein